jgi:hypothetical protein
MSDETYNGWKNYPTWAVNLWLNNDQGTQEATAERVAETIKNPPRVSEYWNAEQTARYNVADMLKDWVEELVTDPESDEGKDMVLAGLPADLMGWTLAQVDWDESASAWIESASEVEA